jgi:hypothetical protein
MSRNGHPYYWTNDPNQSQENSQRLHAENFQAGNGWLQSFMTRHNINFRFLSGESAAVDMEAIEDWKSKLQQVLSEYPPEDQFNADETGLFYRKMPRKNLIQNGEKCNGAKLSKERLSILFCCATGEKLKPLVIGECCTASSIQTTMYRYQTSAC